MNEAVAFEDFPVGRVIDTGAVTVTEAHLVLWAGLTGDWYPLHMDEEWARDHGPFGKRVVHGPLVFALSVGLMERAGVYGESILAWLGAEELRASSPTFIGDTVHVRATVLEARASKSDPARGILSLGYEAINQRAETVMTCTYVLLMKTRGRA